MGGSGVLGGHGGGKDGGEGGSGGKGGEVGGSRGCLPGGTDGGSVSFGVKVTGSAGETVTVLALPPKATKPVRILCAFVGDGGQRHSHSGTMTMTLRLPEATCT